MKSIFDHIDRAKEQPHHIRKNIAFGAATGVTGLIAFVWLAGSLYTGAFAIRGASFADSTGQTTPVVVAGPDGQGQNLAGAAAALQGPSAPAHIEIVDTASSSTKNAKPVEQTILPF